MAAHRASAILTTAACILFAAAACRPAPPALPSDPSSAAETATATSNAVASETSTAASGYSLANSLVAALPPCNISQPGRSRICGYVSDVAGQPIAGATIGIFKRNTAGNWATRPEKTSGLNGWFDLDLVPGEYALKFSHPEYTAEYYRDLQGSGGDIVLSPFLPGPGEVTIPNGVTVLTLVADQAMTSVNATLDSMTGTVVLVADASSECSRIDHESTGKKRFSVCALPDLLPVPTPTTEITGTHTATPQDNPAEEPTTQPTSPPPPLPSCPIVVSVTIPCADASANLEILPESTSIGMECTPNEGEGTTTCTAELNSLVHFVPKQIHTLIVAYECGTGVLAEAIIGFAGFCDPSGHIGHRPQAIIRTPEAGQAPTPIPTPLPVVGAKVTLFYVPQTEMTPDEPGSPSIHVDGNCHIFETRPSPGSPLETSGSNYWRNWSGVESVEPTTSPLTVTKAEAAQLKIATSAEVTTDLTGAYGFLTQPGYCYAVHVEAPDKSWTAWSPIVGNIATPTATPVLDLDLTHIDG